MVHKKKKKYKLDFIKIIMFALQRHYYKNKNGKPLWAGGEKFSKHVSD